MKRIISFLLVSLAAPISLGQDILTRCSCVQDDVCLSLTFNQLVFEEISEDLDRLSKIVGASRNSSEAIKTKDPTICVGQVLRLKNSFDNLRKIYEEIESTRLESWNGKLTRGGSSAMDERDLTREEEEKKKNEELKKKKEEEEKKKEELKKIEEEEEQIWRPNYCDVYNGNPARPMDCLDIYVQGNRKSGVYSVYPYRNDDAVQVLCDLESGEGGWTVFLNRLPQDEQLDFNESWDNFKKGFGTAGAEQWLGNDALHALTSCPSTLRIDTEIFSGDKRWAEWMEFRVANEENRYQLTLGQYDPRSTLVDKLSSQSKSFFTTHDRDNDNADLNCSLGSDYLPLGKGGWWYTACGSARPTAPLSNTGDTNSAFWENWNNQDTKYTSLKVLSAKLRRRFIG